MIGWMPRTATRKPFQSPSSTQTPRAIEQPTITVPSEPGFGLPTMWTQATAPAIAAIAPTERSIPRVAITSVMPSATRRTGALLRAMSTRLPKR